MTTNIHDLMAQLAEQEAELTRRQEALKPVIEALPEHQAYQAAVLAAAATQEALRAALESTEGVHDTPFGKVGYQPRRSLTYPPALVRELCPDLAPLVIAETVDGKALLSLAKTAAKAGKVAEDLPAILEARADVKTTRAWICQLAKATPTPAVATA